MVLFCSHCGESSTVLYNLLGSSLCRGCYMGYTTHASSVQCSVEYVKPYDCYQFRCKVLQ